YLRLTLLFYICHIHLLFFFSSRRRHTRSKRDWSSDVCSSDLLQTILHAGAPLRLYNEKRVLEPSSHIRSLHGTFGQVRSLVVDSRHEQTPHQVQKEVSNHIRISFALRVFY